MSHLKSVEEAQPEVEKLHQVIHPEDGMPSAESRAQIDFGTRTSEHPDSAVLGNHDELVEMNDEISINLKI
jgi:hypothetical protein